VSFVPQAVEGFASWFVSSLKGVGSEKVTLSLHEVSWQTRPAILVVESQRGPHCGTGSALCHSKGDYSAPRVLPFVDLASEVDIDQQTGEVGVSLVRGLDAVKELSPDDAACFPDTCCFAEVNTPTVLLGSFFDEVHSLGVRTNFGAVQRIADIPHQLLSAHLREGARSDRRQDDGRG